MIPNIRKTRFTHAAALAGVLLATPFAHAVICIVPDNGSGTAQMPPQCFSGYLSPAQVHMIVNGLPPGTTILADTTHRDFFNVTSGPGGNLGGEAEQFSSFAGINLQGTGALSGFNRSVGFQLQCQTHIGPRTLGAPVQSFATDFFGMQGQLPPGDPDFDLLRITAGSAFGMPSPGHTTLTRQPGGNWAVDSFFDITYRIDFIGHPGGALGGMSGSTTGTIRMSTGEANTPIFCRCKGDSDGSSTVDFSPDLDWFVNQLLIDSGDLCADMDNNFVVDGRDVKGFVTAVLTGGNCLALDAWETPDSDGSLANSSFYGFGDIPAGHPVIPGGFFGPGSDPFVGQVQWSPMPVDSSILPVDTIVKRPPLSPPPTSVPIEMLALSLVSATPITITTGGGGSPQPWIVNTAISDAPAPGGIMSVQQTGPNGGTFTASVAVRPVFAFTNLNDLVALDAGTLTEDQVRVLIMDTGDPGSPSSPLQLTFQTTGNPWAMQVCGGQPQADGLFSFHNQGFPFIPGIEAPLNCVDAFKPGPMKHVKPGEAHYVAPPNKKPGNSRCGYTLVGKRPWCRGTNTGQCPPAPAVLCTQLCPQFLPCSPFVVRIVGIGCKNAAGVYNRGWCFQFYKLRPAPLDCAICP
jgi:hypothetical protein